MKNILENKKSHKKKRDSMVIYIICFFIMFLAIPVFLDIFIFGNNFPSSIDNSDWASFLGSYIGGFVSLLGIFITIKHTQKENEKERELMYRPYIRCLKCDSYVDCSTVYINTSKECSGGEKNCNILCSFKNVGLGPVLDFKVCDLTYYPEKGSTIEQECCLSGDILETREEIHINFIFIFNIKDEELCGIDVNSNDIFRFCNYGGTLRFKVCGYDLCDKPYTKGFEIHVSSQIVENERGLEYMPEAYLQNLLSDCP